MREQLHIPDPNDVHLGRVLVRAVVLAVVVGASMLFTVPATLLVLVVRGRVRAKRFFFRRMVRMLEWLGPTYIKFGQLSSSRRDQLPASLCDALESLHDDVRPMRGRAIRRALTDAFGPSYTEQITSFDEEPLGSGSIACVYRARLDDGREVALKLKRPGIDGKMRADLSLIQRMVRMSERLPMVKGMPMGDLVSYVSGAILGQLDFGREGRNLTRLREILSAYPMVVVPELYPERSTPNCLVMEYLPGLDALVPFGLEAEPRATAASTALQVARTMMFGEGFVHCDLHPGNLYVREGGEVVVLDAGYCVEMEDDVRRLVTEFFERLAAGDGRRCGEIIVESAFNVTDETPTDSFVDGMVDLVRRSTETPERFDMPTFGNVIFELQRDNRVYASSRFFFPIMALMVVEGTVRKIWPDSDLREVGGLTRRAAGAEGAQESDVA